MARRAPPRLPPLPIHVSIDPPAPPEPADTRTPMPAHDALKLYPTLGSERDTSSRSSCRSSRPRMAGLTHHQAERRPAARPSALPVPQHNAMCAAPRSHKKDHASPCQAACACCARCGPPCPQGCTHMHGTPWQLPKPPKIPSQHAAQRRSRPCVIPAHHNTQSQQGACGPCGTRPHGACRRGSRGFALSSRRRTAIRRIAVAGPFCSRPRHERAPTQAGVSGSSLAGETELIMQSYEARHSNHGAPKRSSTLHRPEGWPRAQFGEAWNADRVGLTQRGSERPCAAAAGAAAVAPQR